MTDDRNLLEPPKSAIMTGFMFMSAHNYLEGIGESGKKIAYDPIRTDYYILTAMVCLEQANFDVQKVLKEADRTPQYNFEIGPAQERIGKVYATCVNQDPGPATRYEAAGLLKAGHKYLSELMDRLGFREITDRDFAALDIPGGGGGR